MSDHRVTGIIACTDCGGIPHKKMGRGYSRVFRMVGVWPTWQRVTCQTCCGRGLAKLQPLPALLPSRSRTATRPEVVILSRHKGGIGDFAVIYVGGKEIAEIPILKAQSFEDGFYESLRLAIQEVVGGTCRT